MTGYRSALVVALAAAALVLAAATLAPGAAQGYRTATLRSQHHGRCPATLTTRYPRFTDPLPLARLANQTLERWAKEDQARFVREIDDLHRDDPRPKVECEYNARSTVVQADSSRLISVLVDRFSNHGGAHPLDEYLTFNFGLVNGRPKRLQLADLFRPGSDYRKRVTNALIAHLRKDPDAAYVREGKLKGFEDALLNRFTVGRDALTFYVNHYEVAPYAAGRFKVTLSARELGPSLRKGVLAGG